MYVYKTSIPKTRAPEKIIFLAPNGQTVSHKRTNVVKIDINQIETRLTHSSSLMTFYSKLPYLTAKYLQIGIAWWPKGWSSLQRRRKERWLSTDGSWALPLGQPDGHVVIFVKFHVEVDFCTVLGPAIFWCSGFRYAGLIYLRCRCREMRIDAKLCSFV